MYGYDPHPTDKTMKSADPVQYMKNGQIDLTVQPEVIKWMEDNAWQPAHFEWHSIRRCNGGASMSRVNVCKSGLPVPADQECKTTGDGFQFLAMHRHMIQSLKQLWPQHAAQFEGFTKFPSTPEELPEPWRSEFTSWRPETLAAAKIADEIDKPENLSRFPDEGAFGMWLQCFAGQAIPGASGVTASGLHGDLHFKWVRTQNSEHGLGNQFRNIDNYMFWKMHGWIDNVWEKYRRAKGMMPDDQRLKDAVIAQCREMDALAQLIDPSLKPDEPMTPGGGNETGVFHTMVRPILENDVNKCTACHGPTAPEGGLTLGGPGVSSATVVAALVNKPSRNGGQFRLVVPNNPNQSWLYLKAAGMASSAGCTPSPTAQCNPQTMPPGASMQPSMSAAELATLRDWIMQGAPAPTSQ